MNLKYLIQKSALELKRAGIQTPDLDVSVLLKHAIEKNSAFIFSHPDYLITISQYQKFRRYIRRRIKNEPIAYIIGRKEFYGNEFTVNKNVLIPRPESEWLVEKAIGFFQNHAVPTGRQESRIMPCLPVGRNQEDFQNHRINILDMGTGSGNIIISTVKNIHNPEFIIHNSNFCATDISKKALNVAKRNAEKLEVENIHFFQSDLFNNRKLPQHFDLIIANLPYVPRSANKSVVNCQLSIDPIDFEPQEAIFADDNGMAIIKRFLIEAKSKIKPNGMILLEVDCRNAKKLHEFAKKQYSTAQIKLEKDLAGLDRFIEIIAISKK